MTNTITINSTVEQHNHKINQEIRNLELFKLRKYNGHNERNEIQSVIDNLKRKLIK
jgi:hypothetical protein